MGVLEKLIKSDETKKQLNNIKLTNYNRDELIKDYIPFIIKTVSKASGRYVEVENDNFYSIGLEAFNEAVDKYSPEKGKFISYASVVIKNRVIDEMRRVRAKNQNIISIEEVINNEITYGEFFESSKDNVEKQVIQSEEINLFINKLKEHHITLEGLLNDTPKHKDTRKRCTGIAKAVSSDDICRDGIWNKGKYMRNRIAMLTKVSEKVLKTNRKIIIATSIAIIGEFETLMQYIDLGGGDEGV